MDSGTIAVCASSLQCLKYNVPRPTAISIDLDSLVHNVAVTRSRAGNSKILASVKANAYGHGLIPCCRALQQHVDGFAVAFCEEAVLLRQEGITLPLLLLEGPFDRADCDTIVEHNLMMTLHSHHQIDLLEAADQMPSTPLWIKIDTGMHRLGFSPAEAVQVTERLRKLGADSLTLMSHFADGENPSSSLTREQQQAWRSLESTAMSGTSLANSAAIINNLTSTTDWLRPGIMLYGAAYTGSLEPTSLSPVMSFKSEIMALRKVPRGETVGYGGRWTAPQDSLIATVPVGYGDGYPRGAEDGTPVWIHGQRFPLVGRVSMDMITVDVTTLPDCQIGTPVELWGKNLPVNEVAQHASTIGYELLTRMTGRAPMSFEP